MTDPRIIEILWRIYEKCWTNIGKDIYIEKMLQELEEENDNSTL